MPVGLFFFGLLATSGAFRPSRRGEFAPNPGSYDPDLIGGDIVPDTIPGSGASQNAFVKNKANLWPRGRVPYRTGLQKAQRFLNTILELPELDIVNVYLLLWI